MLLAYNWANVWQSIKDTWLPVLISFAILMAFLIIIAIKDANKD